MYLQLQLFLDQNIFMKFKKWKFYSLKVNIITKKVTYFVSSFLTVKFKYNLWLLWDLVVCCFFQTYCGATWMVQQPWWHHDSGPGPAGCDTGTPDDLGLQTVWPVPLLPEDASHRRRGRLSHLASNSISCTYFQLLHKTLSWSWRETVAIADNDVQTSCEWLHTHIV